MVDLRMIAMAPAEAVGSTPLRTRPLDHPHASRGTQASPRPDPCRQAALNLPLGYVSGMISATGDDVRFDGRSVLARAPEDVVRAGIAHVPEGRRLFAGLTVRQNLPMGAHAHRGGADIDRAAELFPRLGGRLDRVAGSLSGREQQMCAIARGVMARPRLLMIDELSLGLAPNLVEQILERLPGVTEGGSAVLAGRDVDAALDLAGRGTCSRTATSRRPARARSCWPTRACARRTSGSHEARGGLGSAARPSVDERCRRLDEVADLAQCNGQPRGRRGRSAGTAPRPRGRSLLPRRRGWRGRRARRRCSSRLAPSTPRTPGRPGSRDWARRSQAAPLPRRRPRRDRAAGRRPALRPRPSTGKRPRRGPPGSARRAARSCAGRSR